MIQVDGFNCHLVYICHPYTHGNARENIDKVRKICKNIVDSQCGRENKAVPVAPHLLFPEYMSEPNIGRHLAMAFCKSLLSVCSEMWVYHNNGNDISTGMREEIEFASTVGVKVVFKGDTCS